MINPAKLRLFYINFGHFIDHMLMLIFAKAAFNAGISFGIGKDMAYAEMIPYGIPSLILFGACAPFAAFMADKWNRSGMLTVFFFWNRISCNSDWLITESSAGWYWTGFDRSICINLPSCRHCNAY